MIDQFIPEHHIQKHILGVLMHMKYARFRDMRPPKVDTNLYTYHLNILKKRGFVIKTDDGYCLGREGLSYVDRVSIKSLKVRTQPKIITMIVVQNANGDVLLQRRTKQPHIDTLTLPYGKLHIDDESVLAAAQREAPTEGLRSRDGHGWGSMRDCGGNRKEPGRIGVESLTSAVYASALRALCVFGARSICPPCGPRPVGTLAGVSPATEILLKPVPAVCVV